MKSLGTICSCFLFLLGIVSNAVQLEPKSWEKVASTEDSEELLMKIAQKMDQWDKFFRRNLEQTCGPNPEQLRAIFEKATTSGGILLPNDTLPLLTEKLNNLDSKFETISKNAQPHPVHINLLKNLEKKLTRLQFSLDRSLLRNNLLALKSTNSDAEHFGSSIELEEIFMDIASKVDAIYEKLSQDDDVSFDSNEIRHLGKSCRMLATPYKKLLASVDNLQRIIKDIGVVEDRPNSDLKSGQLRYSFSQDIRNRLENILDQIQILRRKNEKNINENERILRRIDKKLDSELEDDDDDDEKLKKSLKKYMIEQRKLLEKNLRKILKGNDDDDDDDSNDNSDDEDDDDDKRKKSKSKKKGKSKKDDSDDDDDDADDDDSDDNDNKKKKKNKVDSDGDDDDDDDNIVCDDSDENGSKSCERENKKAYFRAKKNLEADDTDDDDSRNELLLPTVTFPFRTNKVRKHVEEPLTFADGFVADEPENGHDRSTFTEDSPQKGYFENP